MAVFVGCKKLYLSLIIFHSTFFCTLVYKFIFLCTAVQVSSSTLLYTLFIHSLDLLTCSKV